MKRCGNLVTALCLLAQPVIAAETFQLPDQIKNAPPNTFIKLCEGMVGHRNVGSLFLDRENRFFLFGVFYGHGKRQGPFPHTEMTLNLEWSVWENHFAEDKLGVWGDLTGTSNEASKALPKNIYCWQLN